MKRSNCLAAMAALLLLVGALSANNIRIEWTGTVLNGTDVSNTFGLGVNGNNLTGESFTVEFIVDPTRGYIQSSPNFYAATGGTDVGGGGYLSPVLSASLTINGQSYSFQSNTFGGYIRDATLNRSEIYTHADHQQINATDRLFIWVFLTNNSIPFTDINESLDLALGAGATGVFQASTPNDAFLFSGNLTPTRVRIGSVDVVDPPDVPEPSTTLLMAAGIGVLFGYRRLRRMA
ncbi:MAG: PEP-CTERM sorting domain-containing protein [Bryobacterales bacterium]|nr:PEP-CTERM sorting domain-containing protein [Bryobacterales bacterium]